MPTRPWRRVVFSPPSRRRRVGCHAAQRLDTVPRLAQRGQVLWKRRKQLVKTVLSLACGPGLVKGWKSIAQSWAYRAPVISLTI